MKFDVPEILEDLQKQRQAVIDHTNELAAKSTTGRISGEYIVDLAIIEFQEYYHKGHIIKWSSFPYSIKKCFVQSMRYHQGGRDKVLTGIFGELSWTLGSSDNQPFDDIIDNYLKINYNATDHVLIMLNDKDYNDIVDFVTTI